MQNPFCHVTNLFQGLGCGIFKVGHYLAYTHKQITHMYTICVYSINISIQIYRYI